MKITYIHHSSFLIELSNCYLLFDYFSGDLPSLNPSKTLFVFASHHHGDHFSKQIFDLFPAQPQVYYILSDDIPRKQVPSSAIDRVKWVSANEAIHFHGLQIHTYQSTDEGVAFFISTAETSLFHAGDLNHWNWPTEPDEWNQVMTANYHHELDLIKGKQIHVAFLPLDPRLGANFYLGIDDFVKTVGADIIFPMHFWDDFTTIPRFKSLPCTANYRNTVINIDKKGECYDIN